jgi:DNA polymerase/3'-5' exonuclease PolX
MPVHNADVASIFDEIADLLELDNANPFRIRAYRNAARTVTSSCHRWLYNASASLRVGRVGSTL